MNLIQQSIFPGYEKELEQIEKHFKKSKRKTKNKGDKK